MRTDQYYATCFPFPLLEQFLEPPLNYERPYDPYMRGRRELAFGFMKQQQAIPDPQAPSIIKVQAASEGLLRYQSFGAQDGKPFAQRLRERMDQNKNTTRIDVGPIYALTPEEARKRPCGVEFRELIFDIDIFPDYRERTAAGHLRGVLAIPLCCCARTGLSPPDSLGIPRVYVVV